MGRVLQSLTAGAFAFALGAAAIAGGTVSAPSADIFGEGGFFVGCNYWAKHAGMYMWSQWKPDVVEAELAALSRHGVTVMRVFPLWSDFQPLTGDCDGGGSYRSFRFRDNRDLPNDAGVDPEMMRRFRAFCDMAEKYRISLVVGIVTGWMSGRQFVPPVFEERNVLTDPAAVMWQTKFVKFFVREMRDHRAIAAWDYGNECNCMGANNREAFYNWMDHIGMAIRSQDSTRPVVSGMHGLSTRERSATPIRLNGELSDVLCTHPYAYYVAGCGKEAFNTMRTELHPTAESLLYRDLGGKPCFVEEIGSLGTSCVSGARTAAGMRATMFSAWANDLKGCLWWCNADHDAIELPPYSLTGNERELGMLRQDLTPKPVMLEMEAFQKFRATLPFARLPKAKAEAVIVVPEKVDGWIGGFGAYLLSRQAGFNARFAGAERELPEAPLYVLTSVMTEIGYSYPAQKRVYERAKAGSTVLIVYEGGMRLTALRENAGVEVDYCSLSPREIAFDWKGSTIESHDSKTCRLLDGEAEVLARTASGEPVFTRHALGKGQVLLVNAPLDRQTVERTDVLTGRRIQPYYRIFAEAAKRAGLSGAVVRGDCPFVGVTEHQLADGSTVVMAVNYEDRAVTCPVSLKGKLGRVWRGEVKADAVSLPPNEAALFEVVR